MATVLVGAVLFFLGFFVAALMSANGGDHYESIESEKEAFSCSDVIRNR